MKDFKMITRYGDIIPCLWKESGKYYFMDTHDLFYVSIISNPDNDKIIEGIDPEGYHIISVGHTFEDTNRVISKIEPSYDGFKIYLN